MANANPHNRFQELYLEHYASILGYCIRRIDRNQAQDVAAEVFVVAWRRLDDVPTGDGTLPWLYAVAARTLSNFRRSTHRRTRLSSRLLGLGHQTASAAETQVGRRTEDQHMIDAINRLSETDREILLLSAWEGMTAGQIALRFEISLKASEKRLTRAKQRLAQKLERNHTRSIAVTAPQTQEGGGS